MKNVIDAALWLPIPKSYDMFAFHTDVSMWFSESSENEQCKREKKNTHTDYLDQTKEMYTFRDFTSFGRKMIKQFFKHFKKCLCN